MVGILPRCIQDLLIQANQLNGDKLKVSVAGRYGFLKPNQSTLGATHAFTQITNPELFFNKVLSWNSNDSHASVKTLLVQFKVEKMVTNEQTDVNLLSIYRFPSLDAYKSVIKLAKEETEKAY